MAFERERRSNKKTTIIITRHSITRLKLIQGREGESDKQKERGERVQSFTHIHTYTDTSASSSLRIGIAPRTAYSAFTTCGLMFSTRSTRAPAKKKRNPSMFIHNHTHTHAHTHKYKHTYIHTYIFIVTWSSSGHESTTEARNER